MTVIGATLGRLPAAVFIIAGLIGFAWLGQGLNLKPEDISLWLGGKVLYDIQVAIAIMPLLVALAALTSLVFMIGGHHVGAAIAATIGAVLLVIDVLWYVALGTWATHHLGAA